MKEYFVYIMCGRNRVLYTGVSNDLQRRVNEHTSSLLPGFTNQYQVDTLVYVESFTDVRYAIAREKQVKSWRRSKKIALIESRNADWRDLGAGW